MNSPDKSPNLDDPNKTEDSIPQESSILFREKDEISLDNLENADKFDQIELKIEKDEIYTNDITFGTHISSTNKNPRRIGNLYVLLYNSQGEPLIVIGPHWPFFICLSTTITLINFLFFYFLWDILTPTVEWIGLLIYFSQITSYIYIFLKNPGLPSLKNQMRVMPRKIESGYKFCDQCHIMVNVGENTNHCDDCNICVIGYDHHCPWTSKCIGKGNLNGFYVFITLTMVLFGYLIYAISMMNVTSN